MLFLKKNNKVIMQKTRLAEDFFSKAKGLMFEKKENFDYALVFVLEKESKIGSSVHMMFVFFPIDIVYLDPEKKAVDKATLKPWTLNYTPKKPAKYFVELPEGKAIGIKIGDELDWKST